MANDNVAKQPPVEPSAGARAAAKIVRDYYLALKAEGFTDMQALTIVGHMLLSGKG